MQKLVDPIPFDQLVSCADLNANPAFPDIFTNASLKRIGTLPANTVSSPFATNNTPANGNWVFVGPNGVNPNSRLHIQGSPQFPQPYRNGVGFSVITTSGTPIRVKAFIVKDSLGGSNVYYYPGPGVLADGTLIAKNFANIVEIEACPNFSGTTAADITISGRVMRGKGGTGIAEATVRLYGGSLSEPLVVRTGKKGFFRIENVPMGVYVVSVSHNDWVFTEDSQVLSLTDSTDEVEFRGRPKAP